MPRKIYSTEPKLEIVEKYLTNNIGAGKLAQEYHIGSRADILKWISAYKEHGVNGLCTTKLIF